MEITRPAALPRTRSTVADELRALGVRPGSALLVHSSISSLGGWICGGGVAVAEALLEVLGEAGTLVVPTHNSDNSDPAAWTNPPVPQGWWQAIRDELPPFDRRVTPSFGMGILAEVVRGWRGARRSDHPSSSFAAVGRHAQLITSGHHLSSGFGDDSPLARIYDLDGDVLLLGVGYGSNSSFHLAEYRVLGPPTHMVGAAVRRRGQRRWINYSDVNIDASDFTVLGQAFEADGDLRAGRIGSAECRLFRQRKAVDFAVGWLPAHRVRP